MKSLRGFLLPLLSAAVLGLVVMAASPAGTLAQQATKPAPEWALNARVWNMQERWNIKN